LIAPLGLVAVLINTALVTVATYVTAIACDRIILYLQGGAQRSEVRNLRDQSELQRPDVNDLDRR
jgi:hypothetical protein